MLYTIYADAALRSRTTNSRATRNSLHNVPRGVSVSKPQSNTSTAK